MDSTRGRRHGPGISDSAREGPTTLHGSYSDLSRGAIIPVDIYALPANVEPDSYLNDRELADLVARFKLLSASVSDKVVRPGFGKRSATITLRANFFKLSHSTDLIFYDFTIKMEPTVRPEEKELQNRLVDLFKRSKDLAPFVHKIAHDSAQRLIARKAMPRSFSATITTYADGEGEPCLNGKAYTVKLFHPKELISAEFYRLLQRADPNFSSIPVPSAFNLIVTSYADHTAVHARGIDTYSPNSYEQLRSPLQLGVDLAILKGSQFRAAVRPVYKSLLNNASAGIRASCAPCLHLSNAMFELNRHSHGSDNKGKFYGRVKASRTYLGYSRCSEVDRAGPGYTRTTTVHNDELGGEASDQLYVQQTFGMSLGNTVVSMGMKTNFAYVLAEGCWIKPGGLHEDLDVWDRCDLSVLTEYSHKPSRTIDETTALQSLRLQSFERNMLLITNFDTSMTSLDTTVTAAHILSSPEVMCQSFQLPDADGFRTTNASHFAKVAQPTHSFIVMMQDEGLAVGDLFNASDPGTDDLQRGASDVTHIWTPPVKSVGLIPPVYSVSSLGKVWQFEHGAGG